MVNETGLALRDVGAEIERVLVGGDLSRLSPEDRVRYYNATCSSLGLNPLTRPFEYLNLNGKTVLYARRDCTEQLRRVHGVSIVISARELVDDVYVVTSQATDKHGRTDTSIGAVPVGGLKGEAKANAMMKAETKSKRRVTLSICGLGVLDEGEVESAAAKPRPGRDEDELSTTIETATLSELDGMKEEIFAITGANKDHPLRVKARDRVAKLATEALP